jgi:hypothetical protein
MDFVKKNIVTLLCGVVALAAIVAIFWPISGMFDGLRKDVEKSKATYTDVENLRKQERNLPSLVLEGGERDKLTRFPNQKVIDYGKEKTGALTAQSKKMLDTVSRLNVHQLLVSGSLPRPIGRTSLDFADTYLNALGVTTEGFSYEVGLPKLLTATRPPTTDEMMDMAQEIWDKKYDVRVVTIGGQDNLPQMTEEFQAEVATLPEQERQRRALNHKIYLDDDSLAVSADIISGKVPTPQQMWFAQNVYWIEEDVCNAINLANQGAKNILDAPVKHLRYLRAPFDQNQYVLTPRTGTPDQAAAVADPNGVTEMFTISPTGRVCGDLYDVIHFDLILRVDYRKIPQILADLERDRLFTVLATSVTAVDASEERTKNGYVYGNDPIAELSLTCEALFLRSWTVNKENNYKDALMPDNVMEFVGAKQGPGNLQSLPGGVSPGGAGAPENMMGMEQ